MFAGVFKRGKLLETWTLAMLTAAVDEHTVIWLRHGWYALATGNPIVMQGVRAGGVISCITALRLHGVWTPPTDHVHIRGNSNTARKHPNWCRQFGRQPAEDEAVDDVLTALKHAARCLPTEDFLVVCDSVLNKRMLSLDELEYAFRDAPRRIRQALRRVDGRAESGTESMVRLRLSAPNLLITPQVVIPGVGRVDLLVGRCLIIEIDSREHHMSSKAYENDRRRDLHAKALGYRVIRLSHQQVVYGWETVGPLIQEILDRGDHQHRLPVAA